MPVIAVESQVELDVLKKKSLEAAAAGTGMPRGWDAVNAFQAEEFGKELKKVKAAPARPRARAPAALLAHASFRFMRRKLWSCSPATWAEDSRSWRRGPRWER